MARTTTSHIVRKGIAAICMLAEIREAVTAYPSIVVGIQIHVLRIYRIGGSRHGCGRILRSFWIKRSGRNRIESDQKEVRNRREQKSAKISLTYFSAMNTSLPLWTVRRHFPKTMRPSKGVLRPIVLNLEGSTS